MASGRGKGTTKRAKSSTLRRLNALQPAHPGTAAGIDAVAARLWSTAPGRPAFRTRRETLNVIEAAMPTGAPPLNNP